MRYKIRSILLVFLLSLNILLAQGHQIIYYEIIKDDSVVLFFNQKGRFTQKDCSDYKRYTRIDVEGNLNGYFEDLTKENLVLARGQYINGKKQGYFEIYTPKGQMRCKGHYLNNVPAGQWDFFYENGLPERTLKFTETDTLLMRFVDKNGNLRVNEGNGEFDGNVAGRYNSSSNSILAQGRIIDGKPDGKWTSIVLGKFIYCKEEFSKGRLLRGTFPNATSGIKKEYSDKSFLNTFFLINHLSTLEEFRIEKCPDSSKFVSQKYDFDINKFSSDLRLKIDRVIENDFRTGETQDYAIGDNYMSIQFSVNDKGKASDFDLLTSWGQQFFNSITNSIKTQAIFPPYAKTMFFHLKLHFPGGSTYRYNFQFSRDRFISR